MKCNVTFLKDLKKKDTKFNITKSFHIKYEIILDTILFQNVVVYLIFNINYSSKHIDINLSSIKQRSERPKFKLNYSAALPVDDLHALYMHVRANISTTIENSIN